MRRALLTGTLLMICLLLGTAATGCSKHDVDPAAARRRRVEVRLRSTFSAAQARCVLARLDGRTLTALDSDARLRSSSTEFTRFNSAVRSCVVPDATSPTQAAATTTTGK
jgi:hypothetical protein